MNDSQSPISATEIRNAMDGMRFSFDSPLRPLINKDVTSTAAGLREAAEQMEIYEKRKVDYDTAFREYSTKKNELLDQFMSALVKENFPEEVPLDLSSQVVGMIYERLSGEGYATIQDAVEEYSDLYVEFWKHGKLSAETSV